MQGPEGRNDAGEQGGAVANRPRAAPGIKSPEHLLTFDNKSWKVWNACRCWCAVSSLLQVVVGYRWVMFQTPYGTVLFDAVCVPDQFDTFLKKIGLFTTN